MREAFIERAILEAVGARSDLTIWKSKPYALIEPGTGKRLGGFALPVGHPDLAGVLQGGRALYVEVKSEDGQLRTEQAAFRAMLERRGALYILARSPDEVLDKLKELGQSDPSSQHPKP